MRCRLGTILAATSADVSAVHSVFIGEDATHVLAFDIPVTECLQPVFMHPLLIAVATMCNNGRREMIRICCLATPFHGIELYLDPVESIATMCVALTGFYLCVPVLALSRDTVRA